MRVVTFCHSILCFFPPIKDFQFCDIPVLSLLVAAPHFWAPIFCALPLCDDKELVDTSQDPCGMQALFNLSRSKIQSSPIEGHSSASV